jgi:hypothetical protein
LLTMLLVSNKAYAKEWLNVSYVGKSETDAYLLERGVLDIYCPQDEKKTAGNYLVPRWRFKNR